MKDRLTILSELMQKIEVMQDKNLSSIEISFDLLVSCFVELSTIAKTEDDKRYLYNLLMNGSSLEKLGVKEWMRRNYCRE